MSDKAAPGAAPVPHVHPPDQRTSMCGPCRLSQNSDHQCSQSAKGLASRRRTATDNHPRSCAMGDGMATLSCARALCRSVFTVHGQAAVASAVKRLAMQCDRTSLNAALLRELIPS